MTARPTGPQPITIATSLFLISRAADGVPADRHRLGERAELGREPVRHREHQRLLDHDLLGVGAGRRGGEADRVHLARAPCAAAAPRRARPSATFFRASRPVVGDLAAELVAEHDPLIGAHEAVVAGLGEHVGRLVGVVAGVEVGAADPAAQDVEQHLPLARLGRWQVDQLELRVLAGDRLHARARSRGSRLSSNAGSGLISGSNSSRPAPW